VTSAVQADVASRPVAPASAGFRLSPEALWGTILVLPYLAVFVLFVAYPVAYGLWLGSGLSNYVRLWNDPIFVRAVMNTLAFLLIAVNLKLFLALLLSGFFLQPYRWIRWLSLLFILPWAIPSLVTILSFRWMLNAEFGMINNLIFRLTFEDGPAWLNSTGLAFGAVVVVHVWKYLPFWTLILLAGRMAIPTELYESATMDGASRWQLFRYVTLPGIGNLYVTCTLLSTILTLGDFNSVYLLTGGGPNDTTHVLATLGIRYAFGLAEIGMGVATVIVALPLVIPLVIFMIRRLGREVER
jgi:multiple sugar transport system permease protein